MLLYNISSWHYQLVLYVFTKNFFLDTTELDFKAMESQYDPITKKDDFKIIYKSKPKTINFCPYCRAVVAAIASAPFVYLWRLYPHKPKPQKTHAEIMKNIRRKGWIARIIGSSINVALGIKNILYGTDDGMYIAGIIQIGLGVALLSGHLWAPKLVRFIILHSPKWERKSKPQKVKKPRGQSKIIQKIQSKHDIYCPPIFFINATKTESLR